jgi:hypothetical protein
MTKSPSESVPAGNSKEVVADYMPWSDEEEASYMRFIETREQEIYERQRAKIEAEGGDVSMELEDERKAGIIVESEQEQAGSQPLSAMQKRILESWKNYP